MGRDAEVNLNLNVKNRSLIDALAELGGELVGLEPILDRDAAKLTTFAAALAALDAQLDGAADGGESLALAMTDADRAMDAAVRAAMDETQALKLMRQALDDVPGAANRVADGGAKASKATAEMGRAAMNAGQSFQDFAQGGIAGILNNLPKLIEDAAKFIPSIGRMAAAFGGPAGLAAAATVTGVAFFLARPYVTAFYTDLMKGAEEIPKAADALERMNGTLKDNRERLDELAESWGGTKAEADEYNRILNQNVELEKKVNAERERRAAIDAMRKKEQQGDEASGKAATAAIDGAGGVDKVIADLTTKMAGSSAVVDGAMKRLEKAMADQAASAEGTAKDRAMPASIREALAKGHARNVAKAQAGVAQAREGVEDRAGDIVTGAARGDAAAVAELARRMGGDFAGATPEAIRARDMADQAEADAYQGTVRANAAAKKSAEAGRKDQLGFEKGALANEMERRKGLAKVQDMADEQENDTYQDSRKDGQLAAAKADQAAREAEQASKANTPAARLRAQRQTAYDSAAGVAMAENAGEFNPSQLEAIAREAADTAPGLDADSIRQAVYRAAGMVRMKMQADMNAQMGRMFQGGDSFLD